MRYKAEPSSSRVYRQHIPYDVIDTEQRPRGRVMAEGIRRYDAELMAEALNKLGEEKI